MKDNLCSEVLFINIELKDVIVKEVKADSWYTTDWFAIEDSTINT